MSHSASSRGDNKANAQHSQNQLPQSFISSKLMQGHLVPILNSPQVSHHRNNLASDHQRTQAPHLEQYHQSHRIGARNSLAQNMVPRPAKRQLPQPNSKEVLVTDDIDCNEVYLIADNATTTEAAATRNSQSELLRHQQVVGMRADQAQQQQMIMAKTTQAGSNTTTKN